MNDNGQKQDVFAWPARAGAILAGVSLCLLALMTIIDVIMRAFGINLFTGLIEVSNLSVVCIGFLALPFVFLARGHIVVDIATSGAPAWLNRRLDALWNFVAALFLAVTAILVMQNGIALAASGESSATLGWSPLAFHVPAVVGMTVAAITCLWMGVRDMAGEQHEA